MCLCSSQIHLVIIALSSHDPGATFDFLKDAPFSKGPAARARRGAVPAQVVLLPDEGGGW